MICNICASNINKNTIKKCNMCEFTCCYKCIKTYMLSNSKDCLDCMNCHARYTRRTIYDMFGPTFINTTYSSYKKNTLYQDYLIKVPLIQSYITDNIINVLKSDLSMENMIQEIDIKLILRHYKNSIKQTNNALIDSRHSLELYIGPCMNPKCNGFRNHNSYCKICTQYTCEDCLCIKNHNHICNNTDILSAELIKKDTKPCPKCNSAIYKIDGCNQMFCTICHCVFDWNTLEINKDNIIHNPHYFEYIFNNNNNNNNNNINNNNNLCLGDTQLFNILIRIIRSEINEIRIIYFNSFYNFIHDYNSRIRAKIEILENKVIILRMQHLIKFIDKRYFLIHSMKYSKKIEYYKEILLLLDTIKQILIDLLRKFITDAALKNDIYLETFDLNYIDDCKKKIDNCVPVLDLYNIKHIISYINDEFNTLHKLYYEHKEDYNLITLKKTKDTFNYYAIRNI